MSNATGVGTDLLDGAVYGAAHQPDEVEYASEVALRFDCTPVYPEVPRGKYLHIGEGVFLRRCPECDAFVRSYAGIVYIPAFDQHLRDEHGIDTGPMLPRPAR